SPTQATNPVRFDYTVAVDNSDSLNVTTSGSGSGLLTGDFINETFDNLSDRKQRAVITVTPYTVTGNGSLRCTGVDRTIDIWVEPTPRLSLLPAQDTICDLETTDIEILSPTQATNPVRFDYTVAVDDSDSLNVTTSGSGSGLLTGDFINETFDNLSDRKQRAVITVTPYTVTGNGTLRCTGVDRTIDIWVEPTPRLSLLPAQDTICDLETTDIEIQSPTEATLPVRFGYSVSVDNSDSLSVTSSGSGMGLLTGDFINETFDNLSDRKQRAVITVIPYTVTATGATRCTGIQSTIDIWVEPTPRLSLVPAQDTICDLETTDIEILSPTESTLPVRFDYSIAIDETDSLTVTTSGSGTGLLTGDFINETFDNLSDRKQRAVITVTPYTVTGNGTLRCTGIQRTIDIWVEPTPRIFSYIASDTLCNNDAVTINFASPTQATTGIEFNLQVINNYSEISGYTDRNNLITADLIDESITNTGDTARMIMYIFTPYTLDANNNQKCEGIRDTVRVWINPTPRVIPVITADRICNQGMTGVEITSPTVMTHGVLRFDYTANVTGGAGDLVGNTDSQNDLSPGHLIDYTYENTSDTVQSVYYHITPRSVGTGCAAGSINTAEVKVHSDPVQEIIVTNPLTCNSNYDLALRSIMGKGTEPLTIDWSGPFGFSAHNVTDVSDLRGGIYTVVATDNLGCTNSDYIEITKAPPSFTLYSPFKPPYYIGNTSCYDAADGEILISYFEGEDDPYTIWLVKNETDTIVDGDLIYDKYDPGDPSTYVYVNDATRGDYHLTILDINGCYYEYDREVRSPQPISVDFELSDYAGYNISCKGYSDGEISAVNVSGGNGDYKYLWYTYDGTINGDNTLDHIVGVPAGKYYLQITDTLGCQYLDSVTLTEPDGITLATSELSEYEGGYNVSCYGSANGSIDLAFAGGSGTNSFQWTGPDGSGIQENERDQDGLTAGQYNLVVTDANGCTMSFDFTLAQPDSLTVTFNPTVTYDGNYNINCNGGTADLEVVAAGGSGTGYSYEWSTPDGSGLNVYQQNQEDLSAGRYIVKVTDLNGCQVIDSISLIEPAPLSVEHTVTDITCESAGLDNGTISLEVSGGSGPYNYSWSTGADTKDITGLTEGIYYVDITDDYGCFISDTAYVSLPPPLEFEKDISEYNGYNISCFGKEDGSIDISMTSGEEPYSYTWTGPDGFSSSDQDISGVGAGEYVISIVDNNYCTVIDTTELIQPGEFIMGLDISQSDYGGFNVNCYGDSTGTVEIIPENGVGVVDYYWTDGYTGSERTGMRAGQYGIMIVDDNSCSVDTVIQLTQPDSIVLSAEIVQPFCRDLPDGEITLEVSGGFVTSSYDYLWYDNSTSSYKDNVAAGEFRVTVTDDNGCSLTDTITVEPEQENCLTIPNAISPNGDNINDVWNIELIHLYPDVEIRIFNRWGEIVWASDKGYPIPWDGTSNGRKLPVDTYHYIINLHNGTKPAIGDVTVIR
ncbi:MAG: gliding motility-associated C-terminal domain-containing protein, partial [Bacteroidales bacterium]|nr:gliding motility-associated C-terminal domain-containing protein [Bacteroidales bacterium]